MLINGSPEIVLLAIDLQKDLIQMPLVARTLTATPQFISVCLPKLQTPLPNGFIGHDDPALCVARSSTVPETEREAEIQPDRVADNFRWEAKAFVIGSSGVCFHAVILTHRSALFPS